jgi:hypothetical protein
VRSNFFAIVLVITGLIVVAWWATSRLSQISSTDLATGSTTASPTERTASTSTPTLRATPIASATPGGAPLFTDRVVVEITGQQTSWTRVAVDGVVAFEGQINPGDTQQFEGASEIRIRTGNGAALQVTYNGQNIGLLGQRGEVVERFFTPTRQITPTPTLTVTPTGTSVPSPTPSATP